MKYCKEAADSVVRLKKIISKEEYFEESKSLILDINKSGHFSKNKMDNTLLDRVSDSIKKEDFSFMRRGVKNATVSWNIWHITRIEDVVISILMDRSNQIFDDKLQKKLNVDVKDNGVIMTKEEIAHLSKEINVDELVKYNIKVLEKTRKVISKIKFEDLSKKPLEEDLKRIIDEGAVPDTKGERSAIDYWRSLSFAGLILMPITKHLFFHIEDCMKIVDLINKKK